MAAKKGTTAKKTETKTEETKTAETQQAPVEGEENQQSPEVTAPEQTDGSESTQPDDTQPPAAEQTPKEPEPQAPEEKIDAPEGLESLSNKIDAYAEAMAPNKIMETDEILRNQLRLRSIVNTVLATPSEAFNDAMKLMVQKVRANRKGAFSERLVFRGFPQIKLARSERQKLETLVSLFLATADAKQPGKVKDVVDMNVVFRYVKNDDQQQKLQSYYGG